MYLWLHVKKISKLRIIKRMLLFYVILKKLPQRVCCALWVGHHSSCQKELGCEEFGIHDHVSAGPLTKALLSLRTVL